MIPNTLLVVDTETDGLTPADGSRVIEFGAVLFSVPTVSVIACWSELVRCPGDANPNAAQATNRISPSVLGLPETLGYEAVEERLIALSKRADAVVAHNATFDRQFVGNLLDPLPWICTLEDVDWPRPSSSMSLVAIALAHDVGVVQAHRALADCTLITRLFERVHELNPGCLPALFAKALRPKALFQAIVRYDQRHLAKEARFRWEPDTKRWLRRMAREDVAALPFKVVDVEAVEARPRITAERVGRWVGGPAVGRPAVGGPAVDGPAVDGLAVDGPAVGRPAVDGLAVWTACSCGQVWPASQTVGECARCLVRGFAPAPS